MTNPLLIGWFIDDIIANKRLGMLAIYFSVVMIVFLVSSGLKSLQTYIYTKVSQCIVFDIRYDLFKHIQNIKINYFTRNKSGELMSTLLGDVDMLSNTISNFLINFLSYCVTLLVSIIYLMYTDIKLTLFSILFLPLYVIVIKKYKEKIKNDSEKLRDTMGSFSSNIYEKMGGIRETRIFRNEKHELLKYVRDMNTFIRQNIKITVNKMKADYLVQLISFIGPNCLLILGGVMIINGELTIGKLMAFNGVLSKVYSSLGALINTNLDFQRTIVSADRIFNLLNEETYCENGDLVLNENQTTDIEFRNVSFSYDKDREVLKNLSFTIKKGEKIALVGGNGCGKSTIVNLLAKNYEPDNGEILIGGIALEKLNRKSFLSKIGIVWQDNYLFNASIYENILYGYRKATKDEVEQAARIADIHNFILGLPDGYNTLAGERGVMLSGGQRQKICIARAILSDPEIFIMDEATSSVDIKSERDINQSLEQVYKNRTCILITHKISNLQGVDRILVMKEKGRIIEYKDYKDYILNEQGFLNSTVNF